MNLSQLYYFCTLAETLNFHKASEKLNLSQPALSISIARLEEELGVFLFQREGHRVELTKCGIIYHTQIRELLANLDTTNRKIKAYATQGSGHVDVGHIASMSRQFIPINIQNFLTEDPSRKITFSLREGSTLPLISGLESREHDVIFCPYVPNHQQVQFIPILEQEIVAIVPHDHPLAGRGSIDLKELSPYPFVSYMPQSGVRKEIEALIDRSGWTPNIVCDASDEFGIATLVSLGYGVSCVANIDILEQAPGIKKIPIHSANCHRIIYMAYLRGAYQPPAVQEFIKFVRDRRVSVPSMHVIN